LGSKIASVRQEPDGSFSITVQSLSLRPDEVAQIIQEVMSKYKLISLTQFERAQAEFFTKEINALELKRSKAARKSKRQARESIRTNKGAKGEGIYPNMYYGRFSLVFPPTKKH